MAPPARETLARKTQRRWSTRNVKRQLRVTLRLHVPLRSRVSVWTFHAGSERNSSGSYMSSRNASILRSLSTVSGGTPFAFDNHRGGMELHRPNPKFLCKPGARGMSGRRLIQSSSPVAQSGSEDDPCSARAAPFQEVSRRQQTRPQAIHQQAVPDSWQAHHRRTEEDLLPLSSASLGPRG